MAAACRSGALGPAAWEGLELFDPNTPRYSGQQHFTVAAK